MVHNIEVFMADCGLCFGTLEAVREAAKDCGCSVTERPYGANIERADGYGVTAVPSIVVDGVLVHTGRITAEEFKQYI